MEQNEEEFCGDDTDSQPEDLPASTQFQQFRNQKGRISLLHEGFIYSFNGKSRADKSYWRCAHNRKCKGNL